MWEKTEMEDKIKKEAKEAVESVIIGKLELERRERRKKMLPLHDVRRRRSPGPSPRVRWSVQEEVREVRCGGAAAP